MALSKLVGRDITDYSERVDGEFGNHDIAVQFDVTDGFVGITAFDGGVKDRVLLSPAQMRALQAFLKRARAHRRRIR